MMLYMNNKLEEPLSRQTIYYAMQKVYSIGETLKEKDFKKAHDLRDKLFSYVVKDLTINIKKYTKRDIEELLNILVGVDDWGI